MYLRIFSSGSSVTPGGFVPYCSMAHAQLSFHGHRDVVKFFVAVPGSGGMSAACVPAPTTTDVVPVGVIPPPSKKPPAMLVLSGGEGYIDFRMGEILLISYLLIHICFKQYNNINNLIDTPIQFTIYFEDFKFI